jgi:hypothetical protein
MELPTRGLCLLHAGVRVAAIEYGSNLLMPKKYRALFSCKNLPLDHSMNQS